MYHDFIWDHCWYVSMFLSFCIFVPNYGRNSTKKNHIEFSCSIFMSFSISDVNLVKHYFSLFGFVWYKSTFDVPGRMSVRPAVCPSVWLSMEILWWNFNVDKNILTKIVWKQKKSTRYFLYNIFLYQFPWFVDFLLYTILKGKINNIK